MENSQQEKLSRLKRSQVEGKYKGCAYVIAHLFLSKGYKTQKSIADVSGYSETSVHDFMGGKPPSLKFLKSICSGLELDDHDKKLLMDAASIDLGFTEAS